jgi:hypothetical protein
MAKNKSIKARKESKARKDNLEPILEENQIVPVNTDDLKQKRNEELKKRVKM